MLPMNTGTRKEEPSSAGVPAGCLTGSMGFHRKGVELPGSFDQKMIIWGSCGKKARKTGE